jgi:hypothetical protein
MTHVISDLRVDGDVMRCTITMTVEEFSKFLLWKQLDMGMSYEECGEWLDRDYPDLKPKLETMTITDGDPEMIGRKLWIVPPPRITFTCKLEPA